MRLGVPRTGLRRLAQRTACLAPRDSEVHPQSRTVAWDQAALLHPRAASGILRRARGDCSSLAAPRLGGGRKGDAYASRLGRSESFGAGLKSAIASSAITLLANRLDNRPATD